MLRLRVIEEGQSGVKTEDTPDISTAKVRRLRACHDLRVRNQPARRGTLRKSRGLDLLLQSGRLATYRDGAIQQFFERRQRRSLRYLRNDSHEGHRISLASEERGQRRLRTCAIRTRLRPLSFDVHDFSIRTKPVVTSGISSGLSLCEQPRELTQSIERSRQR